MWLSQKGHGNAVIANLCETHNLDEESFDFAYRSFIFKLTLISQHHKSTFTN